MKMGKLEKGSLVKFVAVEASAGVYLATGTKGTSLLGRFSKDFSLVCEPTANDAGVIVAGPELTAARNIPLWQVLVKGDVWWFAEDSLLLIEN